MVPQAYPLSQIIDYLTKNGIAVSVINSPNTTEITGIGTLNNATHHQIAFLANPRYADQLAHTQAGAVLLSAKDTKHCPANTAGLIVANPYLAYATLSELFAYQPNPSNPTRPTQHTPQNSSACIHPTAIIDPTVMLGDNVKIGAYCVIGAGVKIGENSQLESHVTLEDFVKIGHACHIKPHSFIGHHCQLGNAVSLHSHTSIGNAGFGFAPKGQPDTAGWQTIHQLGRVIIGNHVRIGSQTCIDRGAVEDTLIEDNVIIDNLVQIAHNVRIGAGTAIAGCVGIAGSTKIGKNCVLAGGVGVVGHIEICDDVTLTGMTMVTKSITQAGSYSSGTPMLPTALWRKVAVKFKNLI